MKTICNYSA